LLICLEVGLHSVTMTFTSSQGVNPIPLLWPQWESNPPC